MFKFIDAPWCGHCKQLAPEYANAAQHLSKRSEFSIKLGKVDATIESELAEKFGIRGYPTLKFFKNGKPIDYSGINNIFKNKLTVCILFYICYYYFIITTGGRTKDEIIHWVTKKSGPAAKLLQSEEEFKSFIEGKSVSIVGYFENVESEAAKRFAELADAVDDHPFGLVSDYSKFPDLEHKDTFVLYKDVSFKLHCSKIVLLCFQRVIFL